MNPCPAPVHVLYPSALQQPQGGDTQHTTPCVEEKTFGDTASQRTGGLLEYVYIISLNLHPIMCERLPCFSEGLDSHGAGNRSATSSNLGSENLEVDVTNLWQFETDDTFQPVHLRRVEGQTVLQTTPKPTPHTPNSPSTQTTHHQAKRARLSPPRAPPLQL